MAQGYSGPEIAEQLTLAKNSVKGHVQHLYAKLGVHNRRQARARARELGLLKPAPHLPQVFPLSAAQPSPAPRHANTRFAHGYNLPQQVTHFFGREAEITQVKERLAEYRLVTLTGPGGVGKTRLSLRVAEELLSDFPDGVWFIELAALNDPALVPQAVANTLGIHEDPGCLLLETLTFFLRDRQVLLVLDNCEHLLDACARLADALVRTCPRLTLLACSREALGIAGEAIFPVPSLPFPNLGQTLSLERAGEYASVRLFVDRARLVVPDYRVTTHNAASLARICQRLDGIPLAIEMAAARVKLLSAERLATRLDETFRVLTNGSRTALPRQQTLRATVDWSYALLSGDERLLLQRLSIFSGGCTLEAAEAIAADTPQEKPIIGDRLASLVAKSMVIADRRQGEETRYRLLEMVRQYAREKFEETGETVRLSRRHRDYFLTFAETCASNYQFKEPKPELDNLRLALEWSFSDLSDIEAGPRLLLAMYGVWSSHQECLEWCKRAIALCQDYAEISADLYARLLNLAALYTWGTDRQAALALSKQSLQISRRLGPERKVGLLTSLIELAWRYIDLDDVEQALAPFAEAEALLQEIGRNRDLPEASPDTQANMAQFKAEVAIRQGRYQDAIMHASDSLRLYRESGDPLSSQGSQVRIGLARVNLGEYDQARDDLLQALRMADDLTGDWRAYGKAYANRWLGIADLRQGRFERSLEYCQEVVRQAAEVPDYAWIATGLGLSACVLAKQGRPVRAARLSGAAEALYAKGGRQAWEDSSLDTLLPGWRERQDRETILQAFEAGRAMTADQALAYALNEAADG